jgi:dihydroorotate dehydrogenase (fumarate)
MANTSVKYMGLTLKNPIIVGSSGLTNSVEDIKKLESAGAGAVVLKSIFEEQIRFETDVLLKDKDNEKMKPFLKGYDDSMSKRPYDFAEAMEYLSDFAKENTLVKYLNFIKEVKKSVSIPVIASINCNSSYEWHYFARRIQEAGADAIELNIYVLPSDINKTSEENEAIYFDIIEAVKKQVTIPISVKISYYFSALANSVTKISKTGIKGIILFNRPFSPDIDIDNLKISSSNIFSNADEYSQTLRWIALLSGNMGCDIAASSGIHKTDTVIKMLLAGAKTVQISSVLYKSGFGVIEKMITELEAWMNKYNFKSIDEFSGKLNHSSISDKASYERVQFMKLYSEIS